MKRLIIKMNLLPWYNEISDTLDLNAPSFPKTVSNKIKTFGKFAIESINKKKTTFVRVKKVLDDGYSTTDEAHLAYIADLLRS